MSLPEGWAEFNDASAIIRGRIVAAKGTFSGTFASDNVEAVREVNIRNGAVSAYYGFDFAAGAMDAEFAIPAQKDSNLVDIVCPISVRYYGNSNGVTTQATANIYKNGTLYRLEKIGLTGIGTTVRTKDGSSFRPGTLYVLQVIRFIDNNPDSSANTTYRIQLINGASTTSGQCTISMLGSIVAGVRKR